MTLHSEARDALAALVTDFGHLTAPVIQLAPYRPNRIELRLHNDWSTFADFEAWREALRIPASGVTTREFAQTLTLEAEGSLAGSTIALIAYGPLLPATAESVRAA